MSGLRDTVATVVPINRGKREVDPALINAMRVAADLLTRHAYTTQNAGWTEHARLLTEHAAELERR